jgi:hypothetical protein
MDFVGRPDRLFLPLPPGEGRVEDSPWRGEGALNVGTNLTYPYTAFSTADVEQLECRRAELEQQRFQLLEETREHKGKLRDLRAQRDTVERQRAALLSARSIEHVQRELADVQRKLEHATAGTTQAFDHVVAADNPHRASDFLAQLTNGNLVRLQLTEHGRRARVVDRAGELRPVESLSGPERDQVYLSLCLAIHSAAAQQGIWLPLVLDDPCARLDGNGIASLAAVLDAFARQGHQVLVFTGQQAAAERLLSLGVTVQDISSLWQVRHGEAKITVKETVQHETVPPPRTQPNPTAVSHTQRPKRKTSRVSRTANGKANKSNRSDAA